MSTALTGNIEIINRNVQHVFANTKDFDMAIYTDNSNQAIHIGCGSNSGSNSPLCITNSNMTFNGDITISNRQINMAGVRILKTQPAGIPTNMTTAVTVVAGLNTGAPNYDLVLSSNQPSFRFLASNNDTVLTTITTDSKIGLRTSNPVSSIHIQGTGTTDADIRLDASGDDPNPGYVMHTKSRGTPAARTAVMQDDIVGSAQHLAWDGESYQLVAELSTRMESDASSDNAAARLVMATRSPGVGGDMQERMVIRSSNVTFHTDIIGSSNIDITGSLSTGGILRLTQGGDLSNITSLIVSGSNTTLCNLTVTGNINFTGSLLSNNTLYQSGTPGLSNSTDDIIVLGTSNLLMQNGQFLAGATTLPSYAWASNSNTGFANPSTGNINIVANASNIALFTPSNTVIYGPMGVNMAANTFPTFALDVNGSIATQGSERIDVSGNMMNVTLSNASVNINANRITSGTLATSQGGTGTNTLTLSKILVGNGTSAVLSPDGLHWDNVQNRLGVNTQNPASTLDVAGDFAIMGNTRIDSAGNMYRVNLVDSTVNIDASRITQGLLGVMQGGTGLISIAPYKLFVGGDFSIIQPPELHWDNGLKNFGINTSSPMHRLDVNGAIATGGQQRIDLFGNMNNVTLSNNTVNINASRITYGNLNVVNGGTGATSFEQNKFLIGNGTNPLLQPNNLHWDTVNSRLAINNSTPTEALDVQGNVRMYRNVDSPALYYATNLSATTGAYSGFQCHNDNGLGLSMFLNSSVRTLDGGAKTATIRNDQGDLRIQSMGEVGIMIKKTSGKVGIGTNAPAQELDVYGTIATNGISRIDSGGNLFNCTLTQPSVNIDASRITTGILEVSQGGTGSTTLSSNKLLVGYGTTMIQQPDDLHWNFENNCLGIGTTGPVSKMHVLSNNPPGSDAVLLMLQTTGGLANSKTMIDFKTYNTNHTQARVSAIDESFSAHIAFSTKAPGADNNALAERMRITTSGNVGIGTTSPTQALDVNGGIATGGTIRIGTTGTMCNVTLSDSSINISASRITSGTLSVAQGGTGSTSLTSSKLLVGNGTTAVLQPTNLHWDNTNSFLGIGNTAPTRRLDITGTVRINSNNNVLTLQNNTGTPGNGTFLDVYNSGQTARVILGVDGNGYGNISAGAGLLSTWTNHPLLFATNTTEKMRITSGGDVGIGTTTPGRKLDVIGNIRASAGSNPISILNNSGTNTTGTYLNIMNSDDTARAILGVDGSTGLKNWSTGATLLVSDTNHHLIFGTNNNERVRITNTGFMGVGTTSPSYTLHVAGNIYATQDVTAFSDARVKTNLNRIENSLECVNKWNGYRYERTDLTTNRKYIGLVAQEVEPDAPELIYEDADGFKSIAYQNMAAYFVEAIKELTEKNKQLEQRIQALEESMA